MTTLTKRQRDHAEGALRAIAGDLALTLDDFGAKSVTVRVWTDRIGRTMVSAHMHAGEGGRTLPTELAAVREELG